MRKQRLKRIHKKRLKLFIASLVFIVIAIAVFLTKLGTDINEFVLDLSEIEVKKLSKEILVEAVNKVLVDSVDLENLFVIKSDKEGNIKTIDLNSKKANQILMILNNNVNGYIRELEFGKSSIIDVKNSISTNQRIFSDKPGIIFEIPMGVITKNAFLSNLGPKIPVRVSLNGDLRSQLLTEVESYGINNAIIKVSININVSEQIILPITSREVALTSNIVIATKMIQGDIPNYYFNNDSYNKLSDTK